ncbi:MAG: hypothetical protein ED859_16190 [Desulfuromonadales bacterium]|nr:MAG: hypothetical protein ED859_16190 [Desulfuromonadales bacterium]
MSTAIRRNILYAALALAVSAPVSDQARAETDGFEHLSAVSDKELDEMRGGLFGISFGITREVTIAGVLQSVTRLTFPQITPGSGTLFPAGLPKDLSSTLQNGDVIAVATGGAMLAPTIVQNTLDGKFINTKTIVDVAIQGHTPLIRNTSFSTLINSQRVGILR